MHVHVKKQVRLWSFLNVFRISLAKEVSAAVSIPVIGIGAGAETDGQVLVFHDTVQYGSHHIPKFVEKVCRRRCCH